MDAWISQAFTSPHAYAKDINSRVRIKAALLRLVSKSQRPYPKTPQNTVFTRWNPLENVPPPLELVPGVRGHRNLKTYLITHTNKRPPRICPPGQGIEF